MRERNLVRKRQGRNLGLTKLVHPSTFVNRRDLEGTAPSVPETGFPLALSRHLSAKTSVPGTDGAVPSKETSPHKVTLA